jgi:myo-inositol-1(or 4)-monophosphatase
MDWTRSNISALMLEAGEIALSFFRNTGAELKPDASLVTQADKQVEAFFKSKLNPPNSSEDIVLGEETAHDKGPKWLEDAVHKDVFIIDPIDGTANYANGHEIWGISLGYMQNGRLSEGAIYLPCLKEMWISEDAHVFYQSIAGGRVASEHIVSRTPGLPPGKGMISFTQEINLNHTVCYSGPKHIICCAVYPLVKLMQGRYLGCMLDLNLWDIAAALPLLRRTGIEISWIDGKIISDRVDGELISLQNQKTPWKLADILCAKQPEYPFSFDRGEKTIKLNYAG